MSVRDELAILGRKSWYTHRTYQEFGREDNRIRANAALSELMRLVNAVFNYSVSVTIEHLDQSHIYWCADTLLYCEDNPTWWRQTGMNVFHFKNLEDAVMFKLKYGDQTMGIIERKRET